MIKDIKDLEKEFYESASENFGPSGLNINWTGAPLIQGPKGDTGDTGPQGPQGEDGPQGPAGPAGSNDHLTLSNIGTKSHDQLETDLTNLTNSVATKMRDIGEQYNKVFLDFIGLSDSNMFQNVLSGGTNTAQSTGANATENVYGALRLTVTTANQYAGGRIGSSAGITPFHMGNGSSTVVSFSGRFCYTTSLPDSTDTTKTHFGFVDDAVAGTTAEPTHFIGFRYDPTVNSGKFQAVVRTSSVDGEAVNLNHTPVVNVNDLYNVTVDITGVARFYINGTLLHTSTTILPAPAALLGPHIKVIKTAGTSARLMTLDWLMLEYSRTVAR